MLIPRSQASASERLADQAGCGQDRPQAIPRISHDQRQRAASGGIWLHAPETYQGRRSVPELLS
jgi:hypothetical protein